MFSGFDTVQDRHGDVRDDNVGRQFHCLFDQGSAIGNLSDDFKLGREKVFHKLREAWVIIREKYFHFVQLAHPLSARPELRSRRFLETSGAGPPMGHIVAFYLIRKITNLAAGNSTSGN